MNNLGKKFEEDLCWFFSKQNYFVEYHEKSISGSQSNDITIIKNNKATFIECKNLENKNGLFPISRIESNQIHAYEKCKKCGNNNFILAILWNNNVYFIDFGLLNYYNKSIDLKKFKPNIINFNGGKNEVQCYYS